MTIKRTNKKPFSKKNINDFDNSKGVYEIIDRNGNSKYVGKSNDIGRRLGEHLNNNDVKGGTHFRTYSKQGVPAEKLENQLIKKKKPTINIRPW
ncbi:MAG: GIY-YIG nuclease family protein [Spirochaetes bacterium]|nr:GIY-YIG nuclease family protein [Spirochaetota bacterium]